MARTDAMMFLFNNTSNNEIYTHSLRDAIPIWDMAAENFKHWEHHKEENIVTYRDKAHPSPVTGTTAPRHHTDWWSEMDDSAESFLG